MVFRDRSMSSVEDFGRPGLLMKRGKAEIFLRLPADQVKVSSCDLKEGRIAEHPFTPEDGHHIRLTVNNFQDGQAVCVYEIV